MALEEEKEIEEAVAVERQNLEFDAEDDDLITAMNRAIEESSDVKELMDKIGKSNELYWSVGTDMDMEKEIHPKRSKVVDNRIFMSVETLIPIVSARTPDPAVISKIENALRETIIMALKVFYEVKGKVKKELQRVIRHWFLYRIGIWKYRWDGKFILETVKPSKMGFDPRATKLDNCEFIWEELEDTLEGLTEQYPKKKQTIIDKWGADTLKSKVKYKEFWGGGGSWVAWKLGEILLDKQKNPNFDYGVPAKGVEGEEAYEEAREATDNLFESPRFPYLLLRVFDLGKTLYDDTSLIEQVKSLQESASKRKRQISDICDELKMLVIGSSKAISRKGLQAFVNKYGQRALWLDRGNINDIKVEGAHIDGAMFEDMAHSIAEIDNIFGIHSTTRGERKEQETLGGRKLLMGSDFGRAEGMVENVEQLLEDMYNAYMHMFKVYEDKEVRFSDGENEGFLHPDQIPNDLLIMVKKGSTLPVDKASRAEMAGQLAKADMVDPETLFEELGYGDAKERVEKLYEWLAKTGKIQPEAGGEGNDPRLVKLKDIMSNPEFKKLPVERQKEMLAKAREIITRVKQEK